MDLLDFFNTYWTIIGGIVSVIGIFFYIQFKQAQFDKDMKTQKENYDKEFTALEVLLFQLLQGYFHKLFLFLYFHYYQIHHENYL